MSRLRNQEGRYATIDDFRQVFTGNLDGLYQLAFLLTVDPEKAEQAFVAAITMASSPALYA
jgi:hypothetical protein